MGTEFFFFYMVELAKFMVDSTVTMEMHEVLTERGELLNAVFGKILLDKTLEFNDGPSTADGGLL